MHTLIPDTANCLQTTCDDWSRADGFNMFPDVAGALTAKGPEANGAPEVDANHYLPMVAKQDGGAASDLEPMLAIPIDSRNAGRDPEKHDEMNRQGVGVGEEGDPAHTVTSAHTPAVAFKPGQSAQAHSTGAQEEVAPSLEAGGGGNNRPAVAFQSNAGADDAAAAGEEVSPSVRVGSSGGGQPPAVALSENQRGELRQTDTAGALSSGGGKPGQGYQAVAADMAVRRLTPTECERLQGFPDGFTKVPYRGRTADNCPDGPRYKALGNSMAVNVMQWIGERIQMVEDLE